MIGERGYVGDVMSRYYYYQRRHRYGVGGKKDRRGWVGRNEDDNFTSILPDGHDERKNNHSDESPPPQNA